MKCLICNLEAEKHHDDCIEIARKVIKKQKKEIAKLSKTNQRYKSALQQLKEKMEFGMPIDVYDFWCDLNAIVSKGLYDE